MTKLELLLIIHLSISVFTALLDFLYGASIVSFRERKGFKKMYRGKRRFKMWLLDFLLLITPLVNIVRFVTVYVAVWGTLRYPEISDKNKTEFYMREEKID